MLYQSLYLSPRICSRKYRFCWYSYIQKMSNMWNGFRNVCTGKNNICTVNILLNKQWGWVMKTNQIDLISTTLTKYSKIQKKEFMREEQLVSFARVKTLPLSNDIYFLQKHILYVLTWDHVTVEVTFVTLAELTVSNSPFIL